MFSPNYSSSSSASPSQFYSRKLLLYTPAISSSSSAALNDSGPTPMNHHGQMDLNSGETRFDANVVMVLSVLFCALVCSLALNSVIKCVRWCSSRINSRSDQNTMTDQLSTAANNTGVKSMTLKTFPTLSYSTGLNLSGLNSECNICLSEFGTGEAIRVLPKCNHGFHINCIDKWLISHSSCPTCRQSLLENCVNIDVSSSEMPPLRRSADVSSSELPPLRRSTISTLEPEGLIRNYRDIN